MNATSKRWFTIIIVAIITLLFVVPLLWLTSVYSEIYPDSYQVLVKKPVVISVYKTSGEKESHCKVIWWNFQAVTLDTWNQIQRYYTERWHGNPESGSGAFWNFRMTISSYEVVAFKQIEYPNDLDTTLKKYGILTEIDLCKMK